MKLMLPMLLTIGLAAAVLVVSCETVQELRVEMPPNNAQQAREWWQKTLTGLDIDTLAVYAGVSQELRGKKASADYCFIQQSRTPKGLRQTDMRLPAPVPEAYLPLVRSRLAGYRPQRKTAPSTDKNIQLSAEPGNNCSDEEAMRLWRQQEARLGWKQG
jgi:hypothetical protein